MMHSDFSIGRWINIYLECGASVQTHTFFFQQWQFYMHEKA